MKKQYLLIETKSFWPVPEGSIVKYEGYEEVEDKPNTYLLKLLIIGEPVRH